MSDNETTPQRPPERRERPAQNRQRPRRTVTNRPPRGQTPRPRGGGMGGVQSGIGENWWTARWIAALERLGWSMRLQRAQAYAKGGNVLRIDVQPGLISAAVKGSQPKPYRVNIRIQPLTDAEWERVTDALAAQALFAARLLAGEMPPTIEDAFAQAGVTLFPTSAGDLYATCSCPDWSHPCKHVAAVHYMLGAEFDRDPFLLFWLRGRSRQQIIEALRAKRSAPALETDEGEEETPVEETTPETTIRPLEECIGSFWQPGESLIGQQFRVEKPEVPESVLRRLGPPPFWRGEYDVMPVLVDAYSTVSREAYALAYGDHTVTRPATSPTPPPVPAASSAAEVQAAPSRQQQRPRRQPRPPRPAEPVASGQEPAAERPNRPRRRWWPRPRRTEPPKASA